MQSMQTAIQLTTFCVKSKEKYKCCYFQKNAIVLCYMPCIYGRSKNLILPELFEQSN